MDGNCTEAANVQNSGCFKEAVCIDSLRVYDSCSEVQWRGYKQVSSHSNW